MDELVQAMDSPDRQYRARALELAAPGPGTRRRPENGLAGSLRSPLKPGLTSSICWANAEIKPPCLSSWKISRTWRKPSVLSGIPATFKLGGREALPNLMPLLSAGDDEEIVWSSKRYWAPPAKWP